MNMILLSKKILLNIYNDYLKYIDEKKEVKNLKKNIFHLWIYKSKLESRIQDNLNLYQFEENERTLNYFNSLCLWFLLYIVTKTQKAFSSFSYIDEYINLYKKI